MRNHSKLIGPTGEFPEGKLNEHDKGELAMAVFHKNGKVIIDFNSPVKWIGMNPQQAIDLSSLLMKHGMEAAGEA